MGSPSNERQAEDGARGMDRLGAPRAKPGLGAAELDLLRRAPDYDAEEMASVRPSGGWPASLARPEPPPAAAKLSPPWLPPNRIEPPAKAMAPAARAPVVAAAVSVRAQFPEERTLALIAEDLLGRPLDEPVPGVPAPGRQPEPHSGMGSALPATGGAAMWDAAMPLVAEG